MIRHLKKAPFETACLASIFLAVTATLLLLSQHQRTLRHWQKLISSAARSAEAQSLADLALTNTLVPAGIAICLCAGAFLARFSHVSISTN